MKPVTGFAILVIGSICSLCLAGEKGGWIYRQYEATEESFAEFEAGKLTVVTFPTETVHIGPGAMPILVHIPGSKERLLCLAMGGPLYGSTDGGRTWRKEPVSVPANLNPPFGVLKSGTMLIGSS